MNMDTEVSCPEFDQVPSKMQNIYKQEIGNILFFLYMTEGSVCFHISFNSFSSSMKNSCLVEGTRVVRRNFLLGEESSGSVSASP